MRNLEIAIPAGLILGILMFLSWFAGTAYGDGLMKKQAIENGVAEYKCDPKTGVSRFVWKMQPKESK